MKLKPLGKRVLLKLLPPKPKSKGEIIIPDNAKEMPQKGKIIDKGDITAPLEIGDKVLFTKYSGTETEKGMIVNEEDIIGVYK